MLLLAQEPSLHFIDYMVLRWSILLALGLLLLGLVGVFSSEAPQPWLPWCNLGGAWAAYFFAADIKPKCSRNKRIFGPIALSVGLFLAGFLAIQGEKVNWQAWTTFAFACAFLILGIVRWIEKERVPKGDTYSDQCEATTHKKESA
jgi:hypothetical protein